MSKVLSIVIPIYNVEKYLDRCFNSLEKNDDFKEVEIVLVDDGSTDESLRLCNEFKKNNSNVKVYKKENGGASDARNFGAQKATGDYIWFVDSDDEITNCLKEFLNYLKKIKPDVMVCQSEIVELNGEKHDECIYTIDAGTYTSEEFMIQMKKNPKSIIFCPQYYIVRRQFIEENNLYFYKGIIYEDELWIPQLLIKAKLIFYTNRKVYYHYMIETSVMHSTKLEKCGRSDYIVATELIKIYDKSGRTDLDFLRDRAANIFLQAPWKIKDFLSDKSKVNRFLPIKNSYYFKSYFKSIVYFVSPKIYLLIHKLVKGRD